MIAAQGRERARARLPARAASSSSSPPTAPATAPSSSPARPAPTWCSTCRAAGKLAAQNAAAEEAAGEILAFSDANSFWEPDALRRLVAALRRPGGRLRLRPGPLHRPGGRQPGGPLLALRDGGARARVAPRRRSPPATARSTRCAATPTSPLRPAASHDLSFPFQLASRGLRSVYVPTARARRRWCRRSEGEFARKRRMMVGLWDIVVGEGMLSPRGYRPLFAFQLASHRLLRYLTPFLHLVALRRQPRAARRRLDLHARRSPCSSLCSPPRCSAGRVPLAPLRARPLLRARHRLDRRRALGPAPPGRARHLGEGGGDAVIGRALDLAARRRSRLLLCSPLLAARRARDPPRGRRPGDLPPAPGRPGRRASSSC